VYISTHPSLYDASYIYTACVLHAGGVRTTNGETLEKRYSIAAGVQLSKLWEAVVYTRRPSLSDTSYIHGVCLAGRGGRSHSHHHDTTVGGSFSHGEDVPLTVGAYYLNVGQW
jgi:hypothetical protein